MLTERTNNHLNENVRQMNSSVIIEKNTMKLLKNI